MKPTESPVRGLAVRRPIPGSTDASPSHESSAPDRASTRAPAFCDLDLRKSRDASEILLGRPPRFLHGSIWFLLLMIAVAAVYSCLRSVDRVVRANGRVEDRGRAYSIEAPFAGAVKEVAMRRGDSVKRGDRLVVLDTSEIESEIEKATVQLTFSRREREGLVRLLEFKEERAATSASLLHLDLRIAEDAERIGAQARRRAEQESDDRISRSKLELDVYEKDYRRYSQGDPEAVAEVEVELSKARLDLARLDLAQARASESMDRDHHDLALEQSKHLVDRAGVARQLSELDDRITVEELRLRRTKLDAGIERLSVELERLRRVKGENILRSKTDGIVTRAHVVGEGEVLEQGSPVVEISPGDLVLRGVAHNRYRGELAIGQLVKIKFAAFPYQEFDIFEGRVIDISPDTVDELRTFYEVTVALPEAETFRSITGGRIELGYVAEMDIVTGRELLIEKLLGRAWKKVARWGRRPIQEPEERPADQSIGASENEG